MKRCTKRQNSFAGLVTRKKNCNSSRKYRKRTPAVSIGTHRHRDIFVWGLTVPPIIQSPPLSSHLTTMSSLGYDYYASTTLVVDPKGTFFTHPQYSLTPTAGFNNWQQILLFQWTMSSLCVPCLLLLLLSRNIKNCEFDVFESICFYVFVIVIWHELHHDDE